MTNCVDKDLRVFAINFRETREQLGLTQRQVSELSGVAQSRISNLERGTNNPSLQTLSRLANVVGVSLRDLFDPMYIVNNITSQK